MKNTQNNHVIDTPQNTAIITDFLENEPLIDAMYQNQDPIMILMDNERRIKKVNNVAIKFLSSTEEVLSGIRIGEALRCVNSLNHPMGCGFSTECEDCTIRKTVKNTFETGRNYNNIEVKTQFFVNGVKENRTLLLSTILFSVTSEPLVFVVIDDITKKIQIKEKIKHRREESRLELESLFENMASGFSYHQIIVDQNNKPTDCKFIKVNKAFEKIVGVKAEDLVGKKASEVFPQIMEEPFDWIGKYGQVALTGKSVVFNNFSHDLKKWLSVNAYSNKKGYFATLFRDITIEQLAEENLKIKNEELSEIKEKIEQSKEYYRSLLETMDDVVVRISPKGRVMYVSPTIEKFGGYQAKSEVGNDISEYFGNKSELIQAYKLLPDILSSRKSGSFEFMFKPKKGDPFSVELTYVPLIKFGKVHALQLLLRNVTKRKNAEQKLKQKNEEYISLNENYLKINNELKGTNKELREAIKKNNTTNKRLKQINKELYNAKSTVDEYSRKMNTLIGNLQGVVYRCLYDGNWTMKYLSQGVFDLTGYTMEEILENDKISWNEIIHPDFREEVQEKVSIGLKNKLPITLSYKIVCKDKKEKWVLEQGQGVFVDNKLTAIEGYISDITSQKEAELDLVIAKEKIEESEARFRSLYENSVIGLYKTTPAGDIILANPAIINMLGYSSFQEIKKVGILKVSYFNPEDRTKFKALIEQNGIVKDYESVWIKKDGTKIFVKENAKAIKSNNGEIIFYEGTVEDITEERKAKEKLKLKNIEIEATNKKLTIAKERAEDSEEKYKKIFDSVATSIIMVDREGLIIDINNHHIDDFGKGKTTRKDYIGKNILKHATITSSKLVDEYRKVLEGEVIDKKAIKFPSTTGGVPGYFNIKGVPIFQDDKVIKAVFVHENITELVEAKEKAEESDKLKSSFLSNMSHEIRTPLNAILGFSQLLNDDGLSEEQKSYIDIINSSGDQLTNIISDILDISKIETNQVKITNKQTDLRNLMNEIHGAFKIKAKEKEFKFFAPIISEDNSIETLNIDATKLQQIISNLLDNAFKFTQKGSVKFGYILEKETLKFFVRDSGMGISEAELKNVFNRFAQTKQGANPKYGGTGLGLSICKGYVELMGGEIWINSTLGKGSEFYFTIPVNLSEIKKSDVEDNQESTAKVIKGNILVAEDVQLNFLLIEKILKQTNCNIIHAKNGKEAVEACNNTIDLVLMDIRMPIMNGLEATRLIKEEFPNIPIIAQTAYSLNEEKQATFDAGCDDFITKPIKPDVLLTIINNYIKS